MTNNLKSRGIILVAALALTACPSGKKCATNADCLVGQVCSPMSGTCMTGTGGGIGGGLGGGAGGGTGGGTTGGGTTGGGTTGGGTTGGGGGFNADGGMVPGGETCVAAQVITPGTYQVNTTGKMLDLDIPCQGGSPGADVVFQISVPAGQRLTAVSTPGQVNGVQYDTGLFLIAAPPANCTSAPDGGDVECLASSDNAFDETAAETGSYFNTTSAAVDVFIVVDSYYAMDQAGSDGGIGILSSGPTELSVTLTTPPADDSCTGPLALNPGTPLTGQTLAGYGDDYNFDNVGTNCTFASSADRVYVVNVPAGQQLTLVAAPENNATLDLALNLVDGAGACGDVCVADADALGSTAGNNTERLLYTNRSSVAQSLLLIVDSFNTNPGTFSLTATLTTPPADDVCSGATALTAGTPLTNQTTTGYENDYGTGTGCPTSGYVGGDRAFSATVPAGQRATVTVTPRAGVDGGVGFSPSVALVPGPATQCELMPRVCASSANSGTTPRQATYTNRTGAAVTLFAIVDSSSATGGAFDIGYALSAPPADDVCGGATALTSGTPLTNQTTAGYENDYGMGMGCPTSGYLGGDRAYSASVPNGQRALVTVTPRPGPDGGVSFSPSVAIVQGAASQCDVMPRVCTASQNAATTARTVSYFNTTGSAAPFFAIVDSSAVAGGPFDISFTASAPVADDVCTTATTTITAAGARTDNLTGFVQDYRTGTNCTGTGSGPDRIYRVTVPANQKYTATVAPTVTTDGGMDTVIGIVKGPSMVCESAHECFGNADQTFRGEPETAAYTNFSASPVDVFLRVGDWEANSASRDFTLTSTFAAPTAGEACVNAQTVTAGVYAAQTTVGASGDVTFAPMAMGCLNASALPDKVYAISVPVGQTLTATVTPGVVGDAALNLINGSSCTGVTMCADSSNVGFEGEDEVVTFTNSGASAQTVFLQVVVLPTGTFSLNVQLQ